MQRHAPSEQAAKGAARFLRSHLGISGEQPPIGIVLGTGWGEALGLDRQRAVAFKEIPGFGHLDQLEGHAREVVFGLLHGQPVIALRGRVHLNERPADPALHAMVRLQVEMLLQLGVNTLILTCAAGSLKEEISVGDIVLIDGFVSLFAPDMPMFAGEFYSPDDTIDQEMIDKVMEETRLPLQVRRGSYVMVRGPFFEGRKYDKRLLQQQFANIMQSGLIDTIGMSTLPEACVAAVYGARTLPLAFVTNTAIEEHSHEENQRRARTQSAHLGGLLAKIVALYAS